MPILKLNNASGTVDVKVPDSEFQVLSVLASLDTEAHGPSISRASKGSISVAAIYKLLSRLEQRGLVHKREEYVKIGDITVRRVLYKVCEGIRFPTERTYETTATSAGRTDNSSMQQIGRSKTPPLAFST